MLVTSHTPIVFISVCMRECTCAYKRLLHFKNKYIHESIYSFIHPGSTPLVNHNTHFVLGVVFLQARWNVFLKRATQQWVMGPHSTPVTHTSISM